MSRYDRYGGYGDWAPYVPVAAKIAQGHTAAKKLAAKEKRQPFPVVVKGRKIAQTFWGLKWCDNLERYQDFANRLPRGATYVRNGSVTDLIIESGRIRAIVGGSEPYMIDIKIQTLDPAVWQAISRDCAQELESLMDLLQGRFSDGVMQRLTREEDGLFPHKREITMKCSCPDSASLCKHLAATLYGVAARLDQQPELLFKLRSVDHLELIHEATSSANLDRAFQGTESPFSDGDLSSIFGIELDSAADSTQSGPKSPSKQAGRRKKVARKTTTEPKAAEPTSAPRKKRTKSSPAVNVLAVEPAPNNRSILKLLASKVAAKAVRKKVKAKPAATASKAKTKTTAVKKAKKVKY